MLKVEQLTITLGRTKAAPAIVDGVNLNVPHEKIVALVGGSGSGKTSVALAAMGLLSPALSVRQGKILFEGNDILTYRPGKMRKLRGQQMAMVFQEPLNAFNPVFPIGRQIEEVLIYHTSLSSAKRTKRIEELLDLVGIPEPWRVSRQYPHQLSGGMRQRAMIAQAIAADPRLIIADEPTSNLDVTLQAKIMALFRRLKDELRLSILLITHDLGVVSHLAEEVVVMKQGKVLEQGPTAQVMASPQDPYTKELIEALKD